jgi:hypothetical protein
MIDGRTALSTNEARAPWAALSSAELSALTAKWVRVGAAFGAKPARAPVDLEQLIMATASAAPDDERLFVVAASWLARHHAFVNGRRLAVLATDLLRGTPGASAREASAVLGGLLSWATDLAKGHTALDAAIARCRPLTVPQPLFRVSGLFPSLAAGLRAKAVPRFAAWGLWHTDDMPKFAAVRPVAWLLAHAPELRLRALAGPTLDADILAAMLIGLPDTHGGGTTAGVTVRDVSRTLAVSYAAAHESAGKLEARGLLLRERHGARQVLRPTGVTSRLLEHPPSGGPHRRPR